MKESFTIHDLPLTERPRERLLKLGAEALSAQEILALILGSGIKSESVMVTAQRLLSQFGNLQGVASAQIEELYGVKGIGIAKASQIKAAFELSKRLQDHSDGNSKISIKNPDDVLSQVKVRLKGKKREHLLVLLLNTRNHLIGIPTISIGSLDSSIVHPREVFNKAICASAASVILVHNHPSGDPQPSDDDIKITRQITEAGKIIGIEVIDHIIVGGESYVSMKERGSI